MRQGQGAFKMFPMTTAMLRCDTFSCCGTPCRWGMTALRAHLRKAMARLSAGSAAALLRATVLQWRAWAARARELRSAVAGRLLLHYQGRAFGAWWARLVHVRAKSARAAAARSFSSCTARAKVLSMLALYTSLVLSVGGQSIVHTQTRACNLAC